MRMSKAEIKMETLKWRMYSGREEAVEARKRYGKRESQGSKEEKGRFAGKAAAIVPENERCAVNFQSLIPQLSRGKPSMEVL